jgi:hypothetical protein
LAVQILSPVQHEIVSFFSRFLPPSTSGVDDFTKPPQCIGALRRVESEDLEVMIHVFPAFEDDIRSLILAAVVVVESDALD